MQILIAGADHTAVVDLATLDLQDAVGERSTARFDITDVAGTLSITRGQAVEISHDGDDLFGGAIDRITRRRVGVRRKYHVYRVECVDRHQLADRRIVAESYQNQTAGAIVNDLLAKYLAGDGVWQDAALSFDGNDYVEVLRNVYSDDMTLEAWIYPEVINDGSYHGFLGYQGASTYYRPFDLWVAPTDGGLHWWISKSDNSAFSAQNEAGFFTQANVWYHVAMVKSGTTLNIYRNGELFVTRTLAFSDIYKPSVFWMGKVNNYFDGLLNEVRIWNFARIQAEIQADMNRRLTGDETGLVGLWRIEEGSGSTVKDATPNGNDGTIYGATWVEQTIQAGPTVTEAVFNYIQTTRALETLAEFAGCAWWIDADKKLYFVPRETYAAPWDLTDEKGNDIAIDEGQEGYRNRQYIKAGLDMTDSQTETRKGDGNTKSFAMGFPLAKVPTVKVNTATKTVGIKGVDTGKDWYWSKGDPVITQDQAAAALTSADTLEVTYQGLFNVVALSEDTAAVQERKAVEGGTGYYEAVADEPHLSTRQAAFESAAAKLRRYAKLAQTITFNTAYSGLRPGQLLTVYLPDLGIDGEQYLIEEVSLSHVAGDKWQWNVKAVSGEALGGWVKFFKDLAGKTVAVRENISEDQVLVLLVSAGAETWRWTESQTVTVWSCPVPASTLYPSTTLYPC